MIIQKYKIILQSDLCVADGGVYNSMLDIDVCYDKYGFPYIPAKRLKGCLRECALELLDWDYLTENDIRDLFGVAGKAANTGKIRISNAYPENYKAYIEEIEKAGKTIIYHPQNVLGLYCYIRNQTAIDSGTGVAKDSSLRSMRVVGKGNCFYFMVCLDSDDLGLATKLESVSTTLRNIGMNRTRGLGEVKVKLCKQEEKKDKKVPEDAGNDLGESLTCLKYELNLLEPMICKGINGGESNSVDYIEGSKVMGLLASQCNNQEFISLLNETKDLRFLNAYISKSGKRLTEVPAYIYSIKNNKNRYVNKLYINDKNSDQYNNGSIQLNTMKHCYVDIDSSGVLRKVDVKMEERYHHSRPANKAIGRAIDSENSKLYQISSIDAGQTFIGYIKGDSKILSKIQRKLSRVSICTLGYGRSAEYGLCQFKIEKGEEEQRITKHVKEIIVKLNSPVIVYNKNAVYSTKVENLYEEILMTVGIVENINEINLEEIVDWAASTNYLQYTVVGGYNVTWGARKPIISAFDKGTVIHMVFKNEQNINVCKNVSIGERITEGYGECEISLIDSEEGICEGNILNESGGGLNCISIIDGSLGNKICDRLLISYLKNAAIRCVQEHPELCDEKNSPTISNMILMVAEQERYIQDKNADENSNSLDGTVEAVIENVKKRFGKTSATKRDKMDAAVQILKVAEIDMEQFISGFCSQYHVLITAEQFNWSFKDIRLLYLKYILLEMKFRIRSVKRGKVDE